MAGPELEDFEELKMAGIDTSLDSDANTDQDRPLGEGSLSDFLYSQPSQTLACISYLREDKDAKYVNLVIL